MDTSCSQKNALRRNPLLKKDKIQNRTELPFRRVRFSRDCKTASPPFEEVGPAHVFEAASGGEHGVGARFRSAAPRSFEPAPDDAPAGAFHDAGSDRQAAFVPSGCKLSCLPKKMQHLGEATQFSVKLFDGTSEIRRNIIARMIMAEHG